MRIDKHPLKIVEDLNIRGLKERRLFAMYSSLIYENIKLQQAELIS
jgi:hypothetical protein